MTSVMEKMNKMQQELKTGDVVKFEKKGDSISGTFILHQPSAKFPSSYAVKIRSNGEVKTCFVNNVVVDLLIANSIKEGDAIMIEYQGKRKSAKGNEYNDYKVFRI